MENEKIARREGIDIQRIHLIISGDVIGVGYRSWALRRAKELELVGWIKNREDDTVELVAEGEKRALEQLIASCKEGPDVAWVERVDAAWQKATGGFVYFEVVY